MAAARLARQTARRDARPELLLRLLLETGIKKGETIRLRREDLDTAADPPLLTVRYRMRGAGSNREPELQARNPLRERRIELRDDLIPLLNAWLEQADVDQGRVFNCSARNLEYVLARLAQDAGLKRLSFEMLRWTCALRDWQHGKEPDDIRDKLGLSESSWLQTGARLKQLAARQVAAGQGVAQPPATSD